MRYIVNAASKEIHDKRSMGEKDNLDDADPKNLKEVGLKELKTLLHEGFDLCDLCFEGGD